MSSQAPVLQAEDLWHHLLEDRAQLIDVRAPIEFLAGCLPSSVNLPILNDDERAQVGTTYKNEGPSRAIELGHRLVSGALKEQRLSAWAETFEKNPGQTFLTCFRGGLRSQLAQAWLRDRGHQILRLDGGYKKMRHFLMEVLTQHSSQPLLVLTGKTGSGKTLFLEENTYPSVNLERLARHRGSAFGAYAEPQPTQINYENQLALELGRQKKALHGRPLLVEDESRMIGSIVQPEAFFVKKRESAVLVLESPLEERVERTFQEYIVSQAHDPALFENRRRSILRIQAKLGGLRTQEVLQDLQAAELQFRNHEDLAGSKVWIEKLLVWYYDPLYEKSFAQRRPEVRVRGSAEQIKSYLASL